MQEIQQRLSAAYARGHGRDPRGVRHHQRGSGRGGGLAAAHFRFVFVNIKGILFMFYAVGNTRCLLCCLCGKDRY